MTHVFFWVLPLWQALILVVVSSLVLSGLAVQFTRESIRRTAVNEAANQVRIIGAELRRAGYLWRGRLVEAAAETVRRFGEGRGRLPPLAGRRPGENPVDQYIREMRHPAAPLPLVALPPRQTKKKVTILRPGPRAGAAGRSVWPKAAT